MATLQTLISSCRLSIFTDQVCYTPSLLQYALSGQNPNLDVLFRLFQEADKTIYHTIVDSTYLFSSCMLFIHSSISQSFFCQQCCIPRVISQNSSSKMVSLLSYFYLHNIKCQYDPNRLLFSPFSKVRNPRSPVFTRSSLIYYCYSNRSSILEGNAASSEQLYTTPFEHLLCLILFSFSNFR